MTTATSEAVASKCKQDAEKASIKETMEKLGQPVTDLFMNKDEHKTMDKSGIVPLNSLLRFSVDAERPQSKPKSSSRFGRLSYHSFFSRHNPHPHRVRHINGLNGNPVCAVNDDWYVNTPLSPHPLIKSQFPTTILGRLGLPISIYQCNPFDDRNISKFAVECKVCHCWVYLWHSGNVSIPGLGSDPICSREKDFVLGMVQSALASSHPECQQKAEGREGQERQQVDYDPTTSSFKRSTLNRRKHNRYYLKKKPEVIEEEQPDHIGNAEVLQVHQSKSSEPPSNGKQGVSDLNRITECE
ncbi:uncharacterized protein LOC109922485 [Rhincodon typus]|uniref:uncharacterized protein LOC109922485 n=1 Tax=Rhincodon typus TaxID=259920 RepID=UPI00202EFDC5|nr:uncharacterized protein LOC109922485 [Rhincodon typus]